MASSVEKEEPPTVIDDATLNPPPAVARWRGATFAWRGIKVEVPIKQGGKVVRMKKLLDGVSGMVKPGEIVYVMGPSGSGKSTMLDSLADRMACPVLGSQYLDCSPKTEAKMQARTKYVAQTDDMFPSLTVRETLNTAAALYVKETTEERNRRVDEVLALLGMKAQANVLVGGQFLRGISGGQKRRLSIGIELLAKPDMLFLDEPTSGLDSAASFHVIESLSHLAKTTGMSMIMSIHQPGQIVFEKADKILLLSGGKQVYFGPPSGIEAHFRTLGFEIPPRTSLAEFILDCANADFSTDRSAIDRAIDGWQGSALAAVLDEELDDIGVPLPAIENPTTAVPGNPWTNFAYKTNQFSATLTLVHRGFINTLRNPVVMWMRFFIYILLALVIGTVWIGLTPDAGNITCINGALFFIQAFMVFMSISVLPAYTEERAIFVRERVNAGYSVVAYILAHIVVEVPFLAILSLIITVIIYFLIGLSLATGAANFFYYAFILFLCLLVAESVMVFVSSVIPAFIASIALGALIFSAFMAVAGFMIRIEDIGWWWRWMKYISFHYFAFSSFMWNQYHDRIIDPSTGPCGDCVGPRVPSPTSPGQMVCSAWTLQQSYGCYPDYVSGNSVLDSFKLNNHPWDNIGILIAMVVVWRILAYAYLVHFVTGKK